MKIKKTFLMLGILAFITASCSFFDKLDELTQFDLPYDTSFNIEASADVPIPVGQTIEIPTPPITTNYEEKFEINKTAKNLIEEITLKQMTLQITTPEDGNFDFIQSIELYIKADGLDEVKIASATDIEKGASVIDLTVSDTDLTPYLTGDEISFRAKAVTGAQVSQDIDIDLNSVFHVDAKILGL